MPPFFIHPEKQIIYSTTAKSFLDEYQAGNLWAITGTAGSLQEKEEAAALYGGQGASPHPMHFLTIPRKQQLRRQDLPCQLTGNFTQRMEAIYQHIKTARQAGRPVLLICEDDTQAGLIRVALLKIQRDPHRIPEAQWQFIDSASSAQEERAVITNAGTPGFVTISTSRLARGTDIKLSPQARQAGGLYCLGSFLPRERDQWQLFGRSGRYGDPGDARLIVDKQQLCLQLNQQNLDPDFFIANDFYVQSQQARMDKEKQKERLIRNALSDFRIKITDTFYRYYDTLAPDALEENKKAVDCWAQFTKKSDQLWSPLWPELNHLLKQPETNTAQLNAHFATYEQQVQQEWVHLRAQLGAPPELPTRLQELTLDPRTEHLLHCVQPKRRYTAYDKTQVYRAYDNALDGRAVIYDELFTDLNAIWRGERQVFANTRAWWHGHGLLFADTRALLSGKRPLFATLRAWMNKDLAAKNEGHIECRGILEVLERRKINELAHWVRHQDAARLLDTHPSPHQLRFRIQLIETVLDYAHTQLEHNGCVSEDDLSLIQHLLQLIKETPASEPLLMDSLTKALAPLRDGFFGHALKNDMNAVMKQRQEEYDAASEEAPEAKTPPTSETRELDEKLTQY